MGSLKQKARGKNPRARNKAKVSAPTKAPRLVRTKDGADDDVVLFEKVAEELLHDDRSLFDSLSVHERDLVLEYVSTALVEGKPENQLHDLLWELDFKRKPVTIEEFLDNDHYLGRSCSDLHPKWKSDMSTVFAPGSPIFEWVLTGAIGTGKTTLACAAVCYKIYHMSCLRNPAQYYGLLPDSLVVFGIYSITKRQVADAGYFKLRGYLDTSPYFRNEYPRSTKIDSKIVFTQQNVQIIPGSQELHALGLDLYSFMMDEVNFMRTKSDKESGKAVGQAYDLYNATHTRLLSRFMRPGGTLPGIMLLVSSRNAQTAFLEGHIKKVGKSDTTFVSDYPLWEVKPKHRFNAPRFKVEVGDRVAASRILTGDDQGRPGAKIIEVPGEYRRNFEEDTDQALRDLAGVATFNLSPLIKDRQSIFDAYREHLHHPFKRETLTVGLDLDEQAGDRIDTYFDIESVCRVEASRWVPRLNPTAPRFMHIDIGLSGDAFGIGMSHVAGIIRNERRNPDGTESVVPNPYIVVDLMLRVIAPVGSEVDLGKARGFVIFLSRIYPLMRVTFDGFNSADCMQILRKQGIETGRLSVDRDDEAYLSLRSAHFDRRIAMYEYHPYEVEILDLERDIKKRKVDHPLKNSEGGKGSKDVTDGVAGSVWSCINDPRASKQAPAIDALEDVAIPRAVSDAPADRGSVRRIAGRRVKWGDLRDNV